MAVVAFSLLLSDCGTPPKANVTALNPEQAYELLQYNTSATNWLTHVRQTNPACAWHLELPDQSSQPTEIDVDKIIWCGGAPAPLEFRASAVFLYDATAGNWKLTRFSS